MTFYHIMEPHQTYCFYSVCKYSYVCVCSILLFSIFLLKNILTFGLLQNLQEAMTRCPAHPDPLHAQNPQMKVYYDLEKMFPTCDHTSPIWR